MATRQSVAVFPFQRPPAGEPLYLLLERAPARGGGWQPVTGKLEPRESHADAARRELAEETGLAATSLIDLATESAFVGYDGVAYAERAFAAEVATLRVERGGEHVAHAWLPAEAAATRLTFPENRRALAILVARLAAEDAG